MKDKLDILKTIQKVDAPPFLLTRIEVRIKNEERASPKWVWSLGIASAVLLIFNIMNIVNFNQEAENTSYQSSEEIHLSTNNYLYHE